MRFIECEIGKFCGVTRKIRSGNSHAYFSRISPQLIDKIYHFLRLLQKFVYFPEKFLRYESLPHANFSEKSPKFLLSNAFINLVMTLPYEPARKV